MSVEQESNQDLEQELEQELRAAAPPLPPGLRGRTLARCAAHVASRRQRSWNRLKWAFLGVCAIHWITASLLDAQHASLLAGAPAGSSPGYVAVNNPAVNAGGLPSALRARSQMLTVLMANRGEWLPVSEAG